MADCGTVAYVAPAGLRGVANVIAVILYNPLARNAVELTEMYLHPVFELIKKHSVRLIASVTPIQSNWVPLVFEFKFHATN